MAREGYKIVAADLNSCSETVKLVKEAGGDIIDTKVDVSRAEDIANAVELAEKEFGKLNVVFNNAGIMDMQDGGSEDTPEDVWDKTFNINVKGVWYGCKYALPALRRAGGGSVINTASFVALRGAATPQLAYTASKGAVLALTRELSVLHARENIRFNSLCPGPIRTDLLMKFLDTEQKRQKRLVHVPAGRFAEAKEMAWAALFLASDESSYINGTDFMVDGGLTAAYVTPEGEPMANTMAN